MHANIMHYLIVASIVLLLSIVPQTHQLDDGRGGPKNFCYDKKSCNFKSQAWDGICKTGQSQSPIDLTPSDEATPVALDFSKDYNSKEFWIINNGHTVQVNLLSQPTSQAQVSGYEFDYPYTFAQIHFHWGKNNQHGSEHTVNGSHYAMEAHLVHFDSKYKNFTLAIESGDKKGLAVIAVFLQPHNEKKSRNAAFDTIARNIPKSKSKKMKHIKKKLRLSSLLPKGGQKFYRYFGSLTTPSCAEAVEWTVFEKPIFVRPSSIKKFRRMEGPKKRKKLGFNFRPVQALNGRKIQYLEMKESPKVKKSKSKSGKKGKHGRRAEKGGGDNDNGSGESAPSGSESPSAPSGVTSAPSGTTSAPRPNTTPAKA